MRAARRGGAGTVTRVALSLLGVLVVLLGLVQIFLPRIAASRIKCLKCFFAAKGKQILGSRATIACYTVSIRSMFSSVLDAMTKWNW